MRIFLVLMLLLPVGVVLADRVTKKTQTVFTPTQSPLSLIAKNKNRKSLIISNNGTDAILLQFGATTSSTTEGMTVPVNTAYEFRNVPMDDIYVQLRASTGVNKVGVIEFE